MQLVIKISDDTYKYWKEVKPTTSNIYMIDAIEGIINGIPLPEGHGRMIDADELLRNSECGMYYSVVSLYVNSTMPIIEAEVEK